MKENSAKSIAVGIAVKIVLLAVLVLVLIFTGRQAYTFGYQIFAQEAMSEAPGKKVARSPKICPLVKSQSFWKRRN